MGTGSPNGAIEEPLERVPLTSEEVQRGLFPRTLDDLRFRTPVFSRLAVGLAAHRQKQAKRAKKTGAS